MHAVEPKKTESTQTKTVLPATGAKSAKAASAKAKPAAKAVSSSKTKTTTAAKTNSATKASTATKNTTAKVSAAQKPAAKAVSKSTVKNTATKKATGSASTTVKPPTASAIKTAPVKTEAKKIAAKEPAKTAAATATVKNTKPRPSVKSKKVIHAATDTTPVRPKIVAISEKAVDAAKKPISPMAISSVGAILAGTFAFAGLALALPTVSGPLTGAGDSILTASVSPLSISTAFPYEGHVSLLTWQDAYDDETDALTSLISKSQRVEASNTGYIDDDTAAALASARNEATEAMNTGAATNSIKSVQTAYDKLEDATAAAEDAAEQARAEEEARAKRAERLAAFTSGIDASDWSDDKIAFVAEWGPRIDDYLSGRPACGYGEYFAAAAYDNDIDPRIGAAISVIESGGFAVCFRPNNGWGWGSSSWDSIEEAIFEWSASFSRGYGYDMDYSDCQRYCPTNSGYYSTLRGQMEQI